MNKKIVASQSNPPLAPIPLAPLEPDWNGPDETVFDKWIELRCQAFQQTMMAKGGCLAAGI